MATSPPQPEGWLYKDPKSLDPSPRGYFSDKEMLAEVGEGRLTKSCTVWHAQRTKGDWLPAWRFTVFKERFALGERFLAAKAEASARAAREEALMRELRRKADREAAERLLKEREAEAAHAAAAESPAIQSETPRLSATPQTKDPVNGVRKLAGTLLAVLSLLGLGVFIVVFFADKSPAPVRENPVAVASEADAPRRASREEVEAQWDNMTQDQFASMAISIESGLSYNPDRFKPDPQMQKLPRKLSVQAFHTAIWTLEDIADKKLREEKIFNTAINSHWVFACHLMEEFDNELGDAIFQKVDRVSIGGNQALAQVMLDLRDQKFALMLPYAGFVNADMRVRQVTKPLKVIWPLKEAKILLEQSNDQPPIMVHWARTEAKNGNWGDPKPEKLPLILAFCGREELVVNGNTVSAFSAYELSYELLQRFCRMQNRFLIDDIPVTSKEAPLSGEDWLLYLSKLNLDPKPGIHQGMK